MKKRILILTAALCLLLPLAACGQEETTTAPDTIPVETATVTRGTISSEHSVSGQVASGDQQSVFVAVSARCTNVAVEVGDPVVAGQVICTLDMAATWSSYETARMSYESAQQSYADQSAVLEQQLALAEKNVTGTEALFAIGAASQLEVDNAKLTRDNARASANSALSQLRIGVQNAKSSLQQLESTLVNIDRNGNVLAPISGTVSALSAAKNAYVAPSMPVVTVDSTRDMEISAAVSESLVAKLHAGGSADVTISSLGLTFPATIDNVERSPAQMTHLYGVTLKIPAAYTEGVLSGMFADVVFYTDAQEDTIIVPTEAIQTDGDGSFVFTVDGKDTAHRVAVQTGLVGDGVTEITSGLVGGETLVTVGQAYLKDGTLVRIVPGGA